MTRDEFAAALARHGPALDRWPAPARARAALLRSAACRRVYLAAIEDDPELAGAGLPAARAAALLAGLMEDVAPRARVWPGLVLAACAVAGVFVGVGATRPARPEVVAGLTISPMAGWSR